MLAVTATATAQTVRMTLDDCLMTASQSSPVLQESRLEVEKARLLEGTAFDAPMTGITLTQETTTGDSPDNGLTFSQDFDFPTVYVARHKVLKAETDVARRSFDLASMETEREITACYYSLVHSAARLQLLRQTDSIYADFLTFTEKRFEKGAAGRLDIISARQIRNKSMIDLRDAEDAYRMLTLKMQTLISAEAPVEPASQLHEPLHPVSTDSFDFTATSAGRLADAGITLAGRNVTAARNDFAPGISLAATTRMLIRSFNPYDVEREPFKGNFMKFEVGVSVPLFFSAKRARLRAANRDAELSHLRAERLRIEAENAWLAAVTEYQTSASNLAYFTDAALSEADDMERLARESYTSGEISETECMQYLETVADIRLRHTDAVGRYNQAVIALRFMR